MASIPGGHSSNERSAGTVGPWGHLPGGWCLDVCSWIPNSHWLRLGVLPGRWQFSVTSSISLEWPIPTKYRGLGKGNCCSDILGARSRSYQSWGPALDLRGNSIWAMIGFIGLLQTAISEFPHESTGFSRCPPCFSVQYRHLSLSWFHVSILFPSQVLWTNRCKQNI